MLADLSRAGLLKASCTSDDSSIASKFLVANRLGELRPNSHDLIVAALTPTAIAKLSCVKRKRERARLSEAGVYGTTNAIPSFLVMATLALPVRSTVSTSYSYSYS